jgi:hypothetical protein
MPASTIEEAARERSRAVAMRSARPGQRRALHGGAIAWRSPYRAAAAASAPMRAQLRVVRGDDAAGEPAVEAPTALRGYATTYGQPYTMYDWYGPYDEVVEAGAAEKTLKSSPDVKFLFNHDGMPMARTLGSQTLQLAEDDHGLLSVAAVNMDLRVAQESVSGVERGDLDEMSFAFVIVRGLWSPDYTQYTIKEFDLDRGDTSVVTYGANPTTEIALDAAAADDDAERAAAPGRDRRTLSPEDAQRARRILAGQLL